MSLLLESIKVYNGRLYNLARHEARMQHARQQFWPDLSQRISVREHLPELPAQGLFKLRVLYGRQIEKVECLPYAPKSISSLRLISAEHISYDHKYADRTNLDKAFAERGSCDDILMTQTGLITDSYYCNVAFRANRKWYSPRKPLLGGTRRAQYIDQGRIQLRDITIDDLAQYECISLFNAMIGIGQIQIPVERIVL